jgi:N-acetyl-gamma-glutamylphosphate reductase
MLKDCRVRSDMCVISTDVWEQEQRCEACSARTTGTPGGCNPTAAVAITTPMIVEQMFMMQTQAVQAIG